MIKQIIEEVWKQPLEIESLIDENLTLNTIAPKKSENNEAEEIKKEEKQSSPKQEPKMMQNLLDAFGGRVVN